MTKGPVLFTGLDFSYPKGQTHARGAPSQRAMHLNCTRIRPCGMSAFETLLARPRLWIEGKRGKRLLSDLVLHSYARQLYSIIADSPRAFDLGPEGLPVGGQRISSFSELDRICIPSSSRGNRAPRGISTRSAQERKRIAQQVRTFCEKEQALVSRSVVEYLLLSLPEVDPEKVLTSQNLKTVKARSRLFCSHLQRTRNELTK